ncbi:DNA polymerase I [Granulicella sibirica]|uniref:DNA polymerase I n=1 Tax=Granulicella sibirica TaxID=2479048 RepID=A0A4Q0T120_9BACT|nr:DNA polymerase I [Granulicella sibirica]RXH55211.1 DNA polymerase I [Granulicella sibirica]
MAKTQESTSKPPIYLLDSMAFIFRAYHAMQRQRPMSTRTGIPTAATYVFVNMINKLRKDFQPQYLAAVYDLAGPVFRDAQAKGMKDVKKFNIKTQQFDTIEYAGYKATRTETPPDLIQQQPYIRRALEAFRIPILSFEGFEADDVIGTLSCQLSALGHKVFVVSSDKDMMQLVNADVSILNPTKDNLILDSRGVEEILGVPPERVIDVMALRGDSVDNIPGAPGIGDKGSIELIQQFGTVEAALDRAEEVKKKTYRESLQNNRDNILLSKELVTIHTGVPIEFSLDDMKTQAPDNAACRELFAELEFTTLLKELAPSVDNTEIVYNTKPTDAELSSLLAEARKTGGLAISIPPDARALSEEVADTTTDPESPEVEPEPAAPQTMSLFGIPDAPTTAVAAPIQDLACKLGLSASPFLALEAALDREGVREALEDETLPKQLHDLKAVLRALEPHNVTLRGPVTDVMLESYLVNPTHGSHTLIDIAARTTSRALTHQITKANPSDPNRLPEAAAAVQRLATALTSQLTEANPEPAEPIAPPPGKTPLNPASTLHDVYRHMDLPLVPVLLHMEQAGVRIDPAVLRDMSARLAVDIDTLAEKIYTDSGHRFNINSPKQLGEVLFNQMGLPKPMKYGKGKVVSTAQDVLEELAQNHPIAALVIEHRQLQKLKSTYLDSLPTLVDAEGRIHTTFNQVGTATGRLSSTNPNLQNIPTRTALGREIRAAFIAAPGNVLMSADYSQIELRLMAHFSQDPLLLNAYRTNQDIHTLTAAEVFGVDAGTMDKETRARAKAVNFGIVYGISPFGLAAQLNIDQKIAKTYIETYFDRYKGVRTFIDKTLETVRTDQAVRTAFGRVRPIPDIGSRNPNMRGFAERTAVNTPLQGTAADLIKLAMIALDREITRRELKSKMTLQVHDELLFDVVPEEVEEMQALVKDEMENVAEFSIPIVADVGVGDNWRDIKG